jgi:hypothetical protein
MPAVLAILSLAYADNRMFLAPAGYAPQMAQPQEALAYQPGAYVQMPEPVQVAYAEPEAQGASPLVYAVAGGVLLAGAAAAASAAKPTAVAEPDLEAAEGALQVAMLFSSGSSKGKAAPKRKVAPKRVAKPAPKKKPVVKRPVAKKAGGSKGSGFTGTSKVGGPESFAKNFFSKENWLVQAFSILSTLPGSAPKGAEKNPQVRNRR